MRATVTQIGNSTGVFLPKEAVARLKVKKGDNVFLIHRFHRFRRLHRLL